VPEAQTASLCADTAMPRNPLAWPDIARTAEAQAPYVGRLFSYVGSQASCATWPVRDPDRYAGPWTRPASAPPLLVATRYDPATAYENAVELERILPAARLLTVEGHGHSSLLVASACAAAATERYLVDGTLPDPGATCRPDTAPFDAPPPPVGAERGAFRLPPLVPLVP
jgi:hypothetical protein